MPKKKIHAMETIDHEPPSATHVTTVATVAAEQNDRAEWDHEKEKFLLNRMLVNKSQCQAENGWKSKIWTLLAADFSRKFNMKALHAQWHRLVNLSGTGIDPVTGAIAMDPDAWEKYLNSVPKALKGKVKQFRSAVIPTWMSWTSFSGSERDGFTCQASV
ncbi:hypothetical protein BC829DRAFT_418796 [Chytridium lagenaria]|nr:hypothetical protein BC829DRAFT_418796 [Chytridium lagenaria]